MVKRGQKIPEAPSKREPPGQQARKPDSVLCGHLSGKRVTALLVRPTRGPGEQPGYTLLFGLAPGGVYLADALPRLRCALTAPFHPYPPAPRRSTPRRRAGGLLSVALACGFPRLVISQHPALWCPDFPRRLISLPSLASALNGSLKNGGAAARLAYIFYQQGADL